MPRALLLRHGLPMPLRVPALVFCACAALVGVFQLALAAGAPWGHLTMGGANPGVLPTPMRVAAVVQAALFVAMAAVVLERAGLVATPLARWNRGLSRAVAALMGVSLLMNLATPSAAERLLWAPVAAVLFVTSLVVARRAD